MTRKKYALKKIICHSTEDQQIAAKEIEYHTILKHVNIIECIDSTSKGAADPVINATSQVLLVLPYYHVIFFPCSHLQFSISLTKCKTTQCKSASSYLLNLRNYLHNK